MSNKILVVTSNPLLSIMLSSRLEDDSCIIQSAVDYQLALKTAKDWLPNVVIIDDDLPGKQHLKLCRHLQRYQNILIILGTTMKQRPMTEAYRAGANYYILKQGQDLRAVVLTVQTALRLQPKDTEPLPGLAFLEWNNS